MTPAELLLRAKRHITRHVPYRLPTGQTGLTPVTDLFEAVSRAGPGMPDLVIDALRLLKRATGSTDLREWQKDRSDQDIRQAFDRAVEMQ